MSQDKGKVTGFYRPRNPELSPFHKMVSEYFNEFERVYPERYGMRFGFWRPVIREAIDKFLECGDLRHGFARVRCPDCGEQFFVAFSCKQRGCCPSSLARMVKLTDDGKVIYRANHPNCTRFPMLGKEMDLRLYYS